MSGDVPATIKLSDIEISDFTGKVLNIKSLSIDPPPMMRLHLATPRDFLEIFKSPNVTGKIVGVVWNERYIALISNDRNTAVRYYPEISEDASQFMEREDNRNNDNVKVWEGEFKPVEFGKIQLQRFLKAHCQESDLPKDVIEALKNLRVTEKREEKSENISLDEDKTKTTIEEETSTNIPRRFSVLLPVTDFYKGYFDFEAQVVNETRGYGGTPTGKKVIRLRCLNSRAILQDMMKMTVSMIPKEIPVYYGRMQIGDGNSNRGW